MLAVEVLESEIRRIYPDVQTRWLCSLRAIERIGPQPTSLLKCLRS